MSDEPDTCYRWGCDFAVAHVVFASGFVTAPVAVLHLLNRPRSAAAVFFAMFAFFCTSITLVLCCRYYADLRRPPWPRWLSPASASAGRRHQQDGAGGEDEEPTWEASLSHDLWRPGQPVTACAEMQAALAANRVPSHVHRGDGGATADCAVCLGEVEKGETVRRLPACRHVFHRECIDLWLHAHATCPVCRSSVLPAPERPVEVVVNIGAAHGQLEEATNPAPPGISSPADMAGVLGSGHAHAMIN
ncbi:hypothetical protein ACP70R_029179 [Stipagrostis hirtigluma subsp. patula]